MMLKNARIPFLSLICSLAFQEGQAQKEGNAWTFPNYLSINFNDVANPVVDTSAAGPMNWGLPYLDNSTIGDTNGNLFCYSTGVNNAPNSTYVYDRTHHLMPNGSNLQGNGILTSLLLPLPGSDSIIWLLHMANAAPDNLRLYYSVINKNMHNGLGDVVSRDNLIYNGTLGVEKLTAVKHANGRDWWIFTCDYNNHCFIYFLLSPLGISFMGTQITIPQYTNLTFGKLIFSNDGTKLMNVGAWGSIDVYDFDRCTGQLSNFRDIGERPSQDSLVNYSEYQYLNGAFSPNGNVIYISSSSEDRKFFYQYDLNATDIRASKLLINSYYPATVSGLFYTWHNLAPDGKIYIPITNNPAGPDSVDGVWMHYLDVIENPDVVGTGCNYMRHAFYLGNKFIRGALPTMAYFGLGAESGSICDSLPNAVGSLQTTAGNEVELFPNPSGGIFSLRLRDTNDRIVSVNVEDVVGKEIFLTNFFSSTIDISKAAAGIYFVRVKTQKKKMLLAKVIKE